MELLASGGGPSCKLAGGDGLYRAGAHPHIRASLSSTTMTQSLERDIRFLKRYAVVTSTLLVALSGAAFSRSIQKTKFEEIDVERINVVEPNGLYRMVISNRPRSIGPIYKGKPFAYVGGNRPGIIFFNDEGTE